jgi:peroxin-16
MPSLPISSLRPYLNIYGDFITKNAGAVSQIESALRSLTYIVPGNISRVLPQLGELSTLTTRVARFKDVEIASEGIHSGIQLLSLYHDSLLARAVASLPAFAQKPTPHNRYTKFWTQKSPAYQRLAMMVTMIQYTELLWEMAAKRRGQKIRWKTVIILELAKCAPSTKLDFNALILMIV